MILRLLLLSLLVFVVACNAPAPEIDYSSLAEAEKRLAKNAPASFTLHPGLGLQTFAAEPTLINPTNLDVDERGRVWVCEAQNYRRFNHDHPERPAGDRILILEDTDGDGQADNSKTFYQGPEINAALGIAKLGERVYVAASPNLLVFTDADGDDVPERMDTLFTGLEGVDHDHGVHAVVFGPDGKLYFNFGNEGKRLRLKNGELATDIHGNSVEEGKAFRQGMVFRCNADGSGLEILGHNFRNNFEVALDAYGRLWQSDNDDDGNEGTRINYVMDYGNFGFKDEVTGAAWQEARVGMHDEIPKRHWHLKDPGVVPNLLQTGSGSPTGILVYEGEQLPKVFHGQMIHCEPGHNVVRSYPVSKSGAGYTAHVIPLLKSEDSWFRPSDVCVGPDGSLLVADWYDAGVGGHLMADIERGRIYRLYGEGQEHYDTESGAGPLVNLDHPNQAVRYLAYQALLNDPAALPTLVALLEDETADSRRRARAAWLLADARNQATDIITTLFATEDPDLRELALRLARQYPGEQNADLIAVISEAAQTSDPALLREAALGLRYLAGTKANDLYAQLAGKYDGEDRWYLEALGIASDLHASERFRAWLATEPELDAEATRKLVWRSRAPEALELYQHYIDASNDPEELASFFRALHFHRPEGTQPIIERALFNEDHPRKRDIVRYALASINHGTLTENRRIRDRLLAVMPSVRGTDAWLMITRNSELVSEVPIILDSALASTDDSFRDRAAKLVARLGGIDFVESAFEQADPARQIKLVDLGRHMQTGEAIDWLKELRLDTSAPLALRQVAIRSLANNWNGMSFLLEEVERGELTDKEAEFTARVLSQAWRAEIRSQAIAWLAAHRNGEEIDLEVIASIEGDPLGGEAIFTEYCAACHQVNGEGVRFGPHLDRIGEKLGPDALLAAIAYPSQGIGFGYEGFALKMQDATQYTGYIESQTEDELTLRMMGGVSKVLAKDQVAEQTPLAESLMTEGLHTIMEARELADLIAYLEGLREEVSR